MAINYINASKKKKIEDCSSGSFEVPSEITLLRAFAFVMVQEGH